MQNFGLLHDFLIFFWAPVYKKNAPAQGVSHHLHPVNGLPPSQNDKRRSAVIAPSQFRASDLNLHLSMPDISLDDEEDDEELIRYHEIATMRQQRKAVTSVRKNPHQVWSLSIFKVSRQI